MTVGKKIQLEKRENITNLINGYYINVQQIIDDKKSYNSRLRFMMQVSHCNIVMIFLMISMSVH